MGVVMGGIGYSLTNMRLINNDDEGLIYDNNINVNC